MRPALLGPASPGSACLRHARATCSTRRNTGVGGKSGLLPRGCRRVFAGRQDCFCKHGRLPAEWPVRPWLFLPEECLGTAVARIQRIGADSGQARLMPDPRITTLEMVASIWRRRRARMTFHPKGKETAGAPTGAWHHTRLRHRWCVSYCRHPSRLALWSRSQPLLTGPTSTSTERRGRRRRTTTRSNPPTAAITAPSINNSIWNDGRFKRLAPVDGDGRK